MKLKFKGALLTDISIAMVTNYVKEMIITSSQMITYWSDAIIVAILKQRTVVLTHKSRCAKIKPQPPYTIAFKIIKDIHRITVSLPHKTCGA